MEGSGSVCGVRLDDYPVGDFGDPGLMLRPAESILHKQIKQISELPAGEIRTQRILSLFNQLLIEKDAGRDIIDARTLIPLLTKNAEREMLYRRIDAYFPKIPLSRKD
ncbi:MAG: hypothetical protein HY860_02645 [Chlamydiales bacterium]|nr:hypothetical protein [Chlamydiales bacterium]